MLQHTRTFLTVLCSQGSEVDVEEFDWPVQCPDLTGMLLGEWSNFPLTLLDSVDSLPRGVEAVTAAEGGLTPIWALCTENQL